MRIALLSDIHGNDLALEAVLTDIEHQGGVDAYWILGDLVAIGHAPIRVLERLTALPNARFIRGNTDRYVCTGARPSPSPEEVKTNLKLLPTLLQIEGDFAWTQGAITVTGWLDWLSQLPLEFREILPDGTRCLIVHAAPGTDDGQGIRAAMSESELEPIISNCDAELICIGHTHRPFSLRANGKSIVNPGSVGLSIGSDVRASYAVITADPTGYEVEQRRVSYDHLAVVEFVERLKHPAAEFITARLRGEIE